MLLLKNETASLRLDIVNYEFSEVEYGMDEYDRNWLLLRCTWTEDGEIHKDSNDCLLAQELTELAAGLKVLAAGIKDRYDSDFIASGMTFSAWAEEDGFGAMMTFYLPNTMDGDDTAEVVSHLTAQELKEFIAEPDKDCAKFPERK